jgi:hypothetical protein
MSEFNKAMEIINNNLPSIYELRYEKKDLNLYLVTPIEEKKDGKIKLKKNKKGQALKKSVLFQCFGKGDKESIMPFLHGMIQMGNIQNNFGAIMEEVQRPTECEVN